mgnify:CR=1 FL=1
MRSLVAALCRDDIVFLDGGVAGSQDDIAQVVRTLGDLTAVGVTTSGLSKQILGHHLQYQFRVLTIPLSKVSRGCQLSWVEIFVLSTA